MAVDREDVVDLPERGGGLVEVEAECDEVVDRGLRHSSPGSNGDDSEAAREVPWPRGAGGGWRDPGEDGRVTAQQSSGNGSVAGSAMHHGLMSLTYSNRPFPAVGRSIMPLSFPEVSGRPVSNALRALSLQ